MNIEAESIASQHDARIRDSFYLLSAVLEQFGPLHLN